jgi:hypothetical protein
VVTGIQEVVMPALTSGVLYTMLVDAVVNIVLRCFKNRSVRLTFYIESELDDKRWATLALGEAQDRNGKEES